MKTLKTYKKSNRVNYNRIENEKDECFLGGNFHSSVGLKEEGESCQSGSLSVFTQLLELIQFKANKKNKIYPMFDKYTTGYDKHSLISKDKLERFYNNELFEGEYPVYPVSKKAIKGHFDDIDDLYVSSYFPFGTLILCLDIDYTQNKINDCEDILNELNYLIPDIINNSYIEPSTNKKGIHIYFKLQIKDKQTDKYYYDTKKNIYNEIIKLSDNLKKIINNGRFQCKLDKICGLPNLTYSNKIKEFATVMLMPRINTQDKINKFKEIIPLSFQQIKQINTNLSKNRTTTSTTYKNSEQPKGIIPHYHICSQVILPTCIESIKDYNNPFIRVVKSISYMKSQGLETTNKSILEFYEDNNLFTGGFSAVERKKRISRIKYTLKNYKELGRIKEINLEEYSFVNFTEEDIKRLRREGLFNYEYSINLDDVKVFIHLVEHPSQDKIKWREDTCSLEYLKTTLDLLSNLGVIKNKCNYLKATAIREIAEHFGWIKCIDRGYRVLGKEYGVARKYILGENHPRKSDFIKKFGEKKENKNPKIDFCNKELNKEKVAIPSPEVKKIKPHNIEPIYNNIELSEKLNNATDKAIKELTNIRSLKKL